MPKSKSAWQNTQHDIKPGNILVSSAGSPKLLDFGIAKILRPEPLPGAKKSITTHTGAMTPEYASPEQSRGEPVTEASDVYSLWLRRADIFYRNA